MARLETLLDAVNKAREDMSRHTIQAPEYLTTNEKQIYKMGFRHGLNKGIEILNKRIVGMKLGNNQMEEMYG